MDPLLLTVNHLNNKPFVCASWSSYGVSSELGAMSALTCTKMASLKFEEMISQRYWANYVYSRPPERLVGRAASHNPTICYPSSKTQFWIMSNAISQVPEVTR